MVEPPRSPFGELVYRHRRRLELTQLELSGRARDVSESVFHGAPISERTINAWERRTSDPARWTAPHLATLRTLIVALGIESRSADHQALVDAAKHVRRLGQPAEPHGGPQRLFVAAGRESHLRRLRRAVDAAVAGSPGVVFVSADPGTGKTWLLEEICREAVGRHDELVTVWASCTGRMGVAEGRSPFQQLLGSMVGDLETANPQELVSGANVSRLTERIPAALRAIDAGGRGVIHRFLSPESLRNGNLSSIDDAELQRLVSSLILTTTAQHRTDNEINEHLFRALVRYAAAGPVILVLEDLHWAGGMPIAALSHVIRRLHHQRLPILILGSFRPGDVAPVGPGDRDTLPSVLYTIPRMFPEPVLDLSTSVGGASGRAFIEAMLAGSSHAFPQRLADALFDKTAGLPLFVTGLLRLYEQDLAAARIDDHHDMAPPEDRWSGPMPLEIETVFAEQFERLHPDLKELLTAASVQGSGFWAETVTHMLDIPPLRMVEMIGQLVRQYRLLMQGGTTTIAGRAVHAYQFSHVLFRDYCYDRMTEFEQSHYHAATADAMLTLYGARDHDATGAIAFHLDQANDRSRAAPAYLNAGVHAMLSRDYHRAIRLYARIGELGVRGTDPVTFIHSIIGTGNSARGLGHAEEAREKLEQALDLAVYHNLPVVRGHVLESIAMLDFDAGDMQVGADRLESVIDLFLEGGDDNDAGRAMANLSYLMYGLKRYDEAMAFAERATALATRIGNDRIWVDAQNALGICLIDLGFGEDALEIYRRCIDVCVDNHDTHQEHLCWLNVSLASFEMEWWDDAQEAADRVLEADRGSASRLLGAAEFNSGVIAEGRNDIAAARAHYANSREIREANGQAALLMDSLAGLLRVAVAERDPVLTGSCLTDIQHRIDERGLDGIEHIGRLYVTLIEASLFLNDVPSVREYARRAVAFLTDCADRLSDPAHWESYLTNVSSHRRVFELASSLSTGGQSEGPS